MQLNAQTFLELTEKTGKLAFVDTEDTGIHGDYNSVTVVSVKPYKQKPITLNVMRPGFDKALVRDAKALLEEYLCWVTFYGRGFDMKQLNTRLTRWGIEPLAPRYHVDLYWVLKTHLNTSRRSQAHYLRFFGCEKQKMDVSPEAWNEVLADPVKNMAVMVKRCESDVEGLESLYEKVKHLVRDVRT